jgi:anaerobic selenocysteine-containing dehydrogenase
MAWRTRRLQGEQAVTVHPQAAAERSIAAGQYIRVFNDRGRFVAPARITDQIAPGVVMAPMGAWPKQAKGHSRSTRSARSRSPTSVMPDIVRRQG